MKRLLFVNPPEAPTEYENHDSDDFRYYFSCNGPMHILCERVQYADVWITSEQSSVSASTK